ncbi:Rrf2 family transcriptional regulator [Longimicrobium sp.]|uniref:Rrf2 family transcriptional regulator n=1 Tax=Longimicrobium sp. TaxID=2029185 RepID=UPI003B3B6959
MKRSNRFSVALHVLMHLAERPGEPATSEHLAACARTNPVVVRRTLAGLRQAGLVASAKGHGGGWTLARPPALVTLRDVHAALGERLLFALDFSGGNPGCRVQRAVAGTLDDFLHDAEALLAARLSRITLADVAAQARGQGHGTDTEEG